ncbi:hypothetical protein ACFGVS_19105 [Mucilaginibacter sp. AW1-7]|uniref:hypothetical protein n=1 Tax=Mucilaginibacter sp. AW1-7 TaxID=3349874 RepID=UPI003F73E8AA
MDMSALTLKLIALLFPGLVAALLYRRLTVKHKERSDFMFVLIAITEGIFSYLTVQTLYVVAVFGHNLIWRDSWDYQTLHAFRDLSDSKVIPYEEIICASIAAFAISMATVYISHHNLLNKYAIRYRISNKYGDENLYSNFLNENCLSWVYVKDIPNEIVYCGAVQSFSESDEFKEIVLNEVTVYRYFKDKEYKELYDVPKIYLCFPKDKVIIEQAKTKQPDNEERSQDDLPGSGS